MKLQQPIEPLLTPKTVAVILAVNERKVVQLCSQGVLPAVNVSGSKKKKTWRVRMADLQQFLTPTNAPMKPVQKWAGDELPPGITRRV